MPEGAAQCAADHGQGAHAHIGTHTHAYIHKSHIVIIVFMPFPKLVRFWTHRAWKVRHGVLQTMAEAVASGGAAMMQGPKGDQSDYIITQVLNLVEDPNE